ncbi:uncharacterized protein LOC113309200 isoform X1 [Papaver somniferum]|uniref:uncharacterized protein LOC113309200 isoform X1 n=1 Tax=Papaver somniferum TaxID=3469 RepID=UPI000E6F9455|nr:uncharacterized protein LOC113309200 isoform X1 [Papaver somniferum]
MTTEIKTTADGQKQQKHLREKKRDRQDDMGDVQTSTKRKPTSTADVLENQSQQSNSNFGVSFPKLEPDDDASTLRPAGSALDLSCLSEGLVSIAFHEDYYANKEKNLRPPIIDYAAALRQHKCADVNLFEAADLLKCISNIHPVDLRSELEKETGMFCRDWLTHHQDPSVGYLDIYLDTSCDRDMEKIYESEIYVRVQDLVKTFDKKTVEGLKNFIYMMPMTTEVFNYEMNWAMVDKVSLLFYLLWSFFSYSSRACIP